KKFYRAVKRSREFAINLYNVINELRNSNTREKELLEKNLLVSKEILKLLSKTYQELINKI
ncbi:hypothetical protein, partial [Mycoplasma sp. HS2188]|uniref:hypothetical protein n=1 Tax=Mycoplasma sp. HS2188 TaxID=2976765 RepID=UPI0021A9C1F2